MTANANKSWPCEVEWTVMPQFRRMKAAFGDRWFDYVTWLAPVYVCWFDYGGVREGLVVVPRKEERT